MFYWDKKNDWFRSGAGYFFLGDLCGQVRDDKEGKRIIIHKTCYDTLDEKTKAFSGYLDDEYCF